jgi:glycosyltransferase involved in cell wall biosynthesis
MYNEAARIGATIRCLAGWEPPFGSGEIIFVDDGSTDRTALALTDSLSATPLSPKVAIRIVRLSVNSGKGAAVRAGMATARGAILGFLDADLSASPAEFNRAVELLVSSRSDVLVGSRSLAASDLVRPEGWYRRLGSRALNRVVRVAGLADVGDTQCGLKVFWAAHRDVLFAQQVCTRFAFDVEVLARAGRAGLRLTEMPVEWGRVEGSHVTPMRDGLRMLADIRRIRRALPRGSAIRERSTSAPAVDFGVVTVA